MSEHEVITRSTPTLVVDVMLNLQPLDISKRKVIFTTMIHLKDKDKKPYVGDGGTRSRPWN